MEKEASQIYSHSKLWLFESCPEAYKIKYIDKTWPEIQPNAELLLGDLVHKCLEKLYTESLVEDYPLDKLMEHFLNLWDGNWNSSIVMRKGNAEDYKNKAIRFLINYYSKHRPFKDNTIAIEKRILFDLDDEGKYKIQGYVDRIVKKEEGFYEVHDYKTNEYMKTQEQVDSDRQLAFYHLGIKNTFKDAKKVKLVWHFLAFNHSMVSERTEEQLEKLKKETLELINKIENTKTWRACGKPWCDWCNWKAQMSGKYGSSWGKEKNSSLDRYF